MASEPAAQSRKSGAWWNINGRRTPKGSSGDPERERLPCTTHLRAPYTSAPSANPYMVSHTAESVNVPGLNGAEERLLLDDCDRGTTRRR